MVSYAAIGLIPFGVGSFEWVFAEENGVMLAGTVKFQGTLQRQK